MKKTRISFIDKKEIKFSPKSFMDDFGRVFFYNERVFRKIESNKHNFCLHLLDSDFYNELTKKGYVPNTIIASEFKEEGLVLEHQKILQTLQHEWSFSMFKEAALMVIEVNEISRKYGYELKDAHTMNVLFHNSSPVLVDIGSIVLRSNKSNTYWKAYDEFLNSFFIPLLFWSEGNYYLVRKLLESNFYKMQTAPYQTIIESGLLELLGISKGFYFFKIGEISFFKTKTRVREFYFVIKILRKIKKFLCLPNKISFTYDLEKVDLSKLYSIHSIKKIITELKYAPKTTPWSNYHKTNYGSAEEIVCSDNNRFNEIIEIIKGLKDIKTLIDLAGNQGYFSIMSSTHLNLERIIVADNDENAVELAYSNIKNLNLKNITPILLNFMFSSDIEGTANRLRSDLVVALAVTHHLILTDNYTLPAIFERLRSFSNSYVIVEFMPLGLWDPKTKNGPGVPKWYTINWFRNEFLNHFDLLEEKKLEKNRILFLGKK